MENLKDDIIRMLYQIKDIKTLELIHRFVRRIMKE